MPIRSGLRYAPSRRLEALESRSLLTAAASVAINLYSDAGGVPGELIADATLASGESFFVEIVAEDVRAQPTGINGISVNLSWDPTRFVEIDEDFSPSKVITSSLPAFQFGTVDNNAGTIDDLTGNRFFSGELVGLNGPERFALLHFRTTAAGETAFKLEEGPSAIAFYPPIWRYDGEFTFEQQAVHVVDTASPTAALTDKASGAPAIESQPIIATGTSASATRPATTASPDAPKKNLCTVPTVAEFFGTSVTIGASEPSILPQIVEANTANQGTNQLPAELAVSETSGPDLASIQFTTIVGNQTSTLVRPAFPDQRQFVDITNSGDLPLTISQIQINVPNVSADLAAGTVLAGHETRRIHLTYAPAVPTGEDRQTQSFDNPDGLVLLTNAAASPRIAIGLAGASTFNGDINYDGRVDVGDVVLFVDQLAGRVANDNPATDPNGDGHIDLGDFGPVNEGFGSQRISAAPPLMTTARARATGAALSGASADELAEAFGEDVESELAAAVALAISGKNKS